MRKRARCTPDSQRTPRSRAPSQAAEHAHEGAQQRSDGSCGTPPKQDQLSQELDKYPGGLLHRS